MNILKKIKLRKSYKCTVCGNNLQPIFVSVLTGKYNDVIIEFVNLPIMSCLNSDHQNRFMYLDFGTELIDFIFYSSSLPIAKSGITTIQKLRCYMCNNIIDKPTVKILKEVKGNIEINNLSTFKLKIKATICTCSSCNAEQIYADEKISDDICNAISDAFDSINLDA